MRTIHVTTRQWSGVKGFAAQEELKKIAIAEMKHAETIAERLFYLGGILTTKPNPILKKTIVTHSQR